MEYAPHLYIGIGAKTCFFTLRETYLHERYVPGPGSDGNSVINGVYQGRVEREVRSFHHCNLSQDVDEALAKAKSHATELDLPLLADRESLDRELNEIQRATADEIAQREARWVEQQEFWAAERALNDQHNIDVARQGCFPVGKYTGKFFNEVPAGYVSWLAQNEFESPLFQEISLIIKANWAELILPAANKTAVIGVEGERRIFTGTVIRATSYVTDWGTTYLTTLVVEGGACVLCKSGVWSASEGDVVNIKATIKKHDEYRGQAQTVVQRINDVP